MTLMLIALYNNAHKIVWDAIKVWSNLSIICTEHSFIVAVVMLPTMGLVPGHLNQLPGTFYIRHYYMLLFYIVLGVMPFKPHIYKLIF